MMQNKEYLLGWAVGLVWLLLGLAIMYGLSLFLAAPPGLAAFISFWLVAWPILVGALVGWRQGKQGFSVGLAAFVPLYLLLSMLWWWLLPELFSLALAARAALLGMALAALSGGLAVGLKQAKQLMPPAADSSP
jgi:hypothetical protein